MKDWDNRIFKRIPQDLFDDGFWNNGEKFSKKEAYIDLYFLAHDGENNKPVILQVNAGGDSTILTKVESGQVAVTLRKYRHRWKWSTTKIRKFHKDLEELGYLKIIKKHPITLLELCGFVPRKTQREHSKDNPKNTANTPMAPINRYNTNNTYKNYNKEDLKLFTFICDDCDYHETSEDKHLHSICKECYGKGKKNVLSIDYGCKTRELNERVAGLTNRLSSNSKDN